MSTETTEMDTLYDFSEEQDAAPPTVQTADIAALDLMRTGQFTIILQLFPADDNPAGRPCNLGVQLNKEVPSIITLRGNELGELPAPIFQLMQAQALAAATAKKKPTVAPAPAVPAAPKPVKAAPAAAKPAAPVQKPAPAPVAAAPKDQASQDDIYSLFDF